MVRYESDFHADIMIRLRELRADGDLCDVTLTVGQNEIQAHRCVLAAGSEYFHTLFLGQFKEASMQNINLSEVTSDGKDMEQVIDFMYSGKIDINDDNIEALVRLSAYLLMESLKEYCVKYMEEHGASLRTCLDHYFCCVEHSLDEAEEEKKLMVASRFHDYFVYEDNSNLTLDEIQLLLSNNMFQHCTVGGILQFLFRWLPDDITDQQVALASEILDIVESKIIDGLSDQQKCESREMIVKIEEKLHNSRCNVKILLEKLQKIETFPKCETESQSCPVALGSSSSANMGSPGSNYEKVIVTLSPKQCLVDEFNRQKLRASIDCKETAFSLCCYIPCTKTWYHIQDFENEEEIATLPKTDYHGQHCKMTSFLFKEELVLIQNRMTNMTGCLKVYFYNLRSKSWREVDLPELERRYDDNQSANVEDYCLVNDNANSCLYLILRMGVEVNSWHSENKWGEFFEGLRLRENGSVERLFETRTVEGCISTPSELHAEVSSVSNELIITCGPTGNHDRKTMTYAYIVNLKNEKPTAVDILHEFEDMLEGLAGVQIFQTPTHFYILSDKTVEGRYQQYRNVTTVYVYEYHSETLTKQLYDRGIHLKLNQHESKEDDFHQSMYPCLGEITVSHMKSLWLFEGDRKFFSGLYEVEMDDGGSLTRVKHTPPPFPCVTGMAVGKLPADLVAQWTQRPIARFLHRAYTISDD